MRRIDEIADRYVAEYTQVDPVGATRLGIGSRDDDRLTDLGPEGLAARAELARNALTQINVIEPVDEVERVAKEAMLERLGILVERHDAGVLASEVNVAVGPLHNVRKVFDLMPVDGESDAATIHSRLKAVPTALGQLRRTLLEAARQGHVSARRQLREVARQCDTWADPTGDDIWAGLVRRVHAACALPTALASDLDRAAEAARVATAEFGRFLREDLAPRGRTREAVGRELYALASRNFLGATVDLDETYAWGFAELARINADISAVAATIAPGASWPQAVDVLNADPTYRITGRESFRVWMQELTDRTVADLDGRHFDIPERVRTIECRLAPVSDGSIYYTGPSEDFSRPGRIWWAVPRGAETFSTWQQAAIVYHEGVPGHHLQIGQTVVRADTLNRWRRRMSNCPAHGEGWALYAEHLMGELGYLEEPGMKLGLLLSQSLRAARVIVDIGLHLELRIPRDNPFSFHPGETWNRELSWEFLRAHSVLSDEILRHEVNRYLGWPGQAPAYTVGEQAWLRVRADARIRMGADFDLKAFHRAALDLGPLGLEPLRAALSRLWNPPGRRSFRQGQSAMRRGQPVFSDFD